MTPGDGPAPLTFVLVHGAWHGGWCWTRVRDILTRRGHAVFTPTLTGLGERAHLMSPDITLETHIADVADLIGEEDLHDVVLCGHSYAGWVISGVVEEVEERIKALVHLDGYVPEDGECGSDEFSPKDKARVEKALAAGKPSWPPPDARHFGVNDADIDWVNELLTPHPIGVSRNPIRLTGARERIPKKAYIRALAYQNARFDADFEKLRHHPGWQLFEVPCGHDVMVDMPERLAEILEEVA